MVRASALVDAVARRSYGKLIAYLATRTRDVALAEDALAEAFAVALVEWPSGGCPENPEAWLLTVARRRMIDMSRRRQREVAIPEEFSVDVEVVPDRRLELMFACAHPAIDAAARSPLMLQAVLGLKAETIASAFLVSPAAMGKRLVRAKEKIRQAGIPFQVPLDEELAPRLDFVLDSIYASFSLGWTDPGDVARCDLAHEAIALGRMLVELMPSSGEAHGLLALMLYLESRRFARRVDGEYVPLASQDVSLWWEDLIIEAEILVARCSSLGRYQLEAAIQSAHVFRLRSGVDNWAAVVQLYDALYELTLSPVVLVNRALAIAELHGAAAGLESMPSELESYQPYWAARADLLGRAGFVDEAARAYDVAIGLEADPVVWRFLMGRKLSLRSCAS